MLCNCCAGGGLSPLLQHNAACRMHSPITYQHNAAAPAQAAVAAPVPAAVAAPAGSAMCRSRRPYGTGARSDCPAPTWSVAPLLR